MNLSELYTQSKNQQPTCNYAIITLASQGYGVVSDPFENAPFFHGRRLDLWEFPHIWASGLKPPSSFSICKAGQHKSTCLMLYLQFFSCFFSRSFSGQCTQPSPQFHSTVAAPHEALHMVQDLLTDSPVSQIPCSDPSWDKGFQQFPQPITSFRAPCAQIRNPTPTHPTPTP